jgi:hypothetical protein
MADCLHGLPATECLICKTLGTPAPTAVQDPLGSQRGRRPDAPPVPVAAGARPTHPARAEPSRVAHHLGPVVVGIVLIAAVAFLASGVVSAVLHTVELVLLAVVAGWAGYRVGRVRGRHEHR